jgi:hypothetical protein
MARILLTYNQLAFCNVDKLLLRKVRMKKFFCLLGCLFAGAANATLITNGSFETGNLIGWSSQDLSSSFDPLQVNGSGINLGFGFFSSSPTDGNFVATNGFDGSSGTISISQDIAVTTASTILFDYRAAWDMSVRFGSTLNRSFDLNINSLGGANLASFNILSAVAGTTNLDTGNLLGSVDLSSFIGQTVNMSFDWQILEKFKGPGFFQLDNIRAGSSVPEPTSLALLGLGLAGLVFSRKKKKHN